jgi:hypothetical protein
VRVVRAASQAVWDYAEVQEGEEEDNSEAEWRPEAEEERDEEEEGGHYEGEDEDNDEGDDGEEEEELVSALRVLQEVWAPRNKNYPQRQFRVELSDGSIIKTVAEDCVHPERGTAEANPYYQSVIEVWRAAGNSKPARRQK